jgi:thioredoxin reductase (NADPH)
MIKKVAIGFRRYAHRYHFYLCFICSGISDVKKFERNKMIEKPAILAVDDEADALKTVVEELEGRYGRDYEIVGKASVTNALGWLKEVKEKGGEVALVLSDQWMPEMTGSDFLTHVHEIQPEAKRGLLIDAGDVSCAGTMLQSITFGQADYYGAKPYRPPDERFHRFVTQFLQEWAESNRPKFQLVRIVGEQWAPRSYELRDFLTRGGISNGFYDVNSEDGKNLLKLIPFPVKEFPACILYDAQVLINPTTTQLAEAIGVSTHAKDELYDLTIVGAGPAGLSAAVYGASEGLNAAIIERDTIGGQAGTSSMIRNYLGFPRGISGGELMQQSYRQAWLFRPHFIFTRQVSELRSEGEERVITLSNGEEIRSKAVLLATGVDYKKLEDRKLNSFLGAGVFYGAACSEAPAMRDKLVYVAGAGNSAGQAAVYLAKFAKSVTMLVRGHTLKDSMSDYLIKEIEAKDNITVRLHTEATTGSGENLLKSLVLRNNLTGEREEVEAAALFILIGGHPRTDWLPENVRRDDKGFLFTGNDAISAEQSGSPERPPLPMETSLPGVFAAGDARYGSMKRVASAVGEGAAAIRFVHEYLSLGR